MKRFNVSIGSQVILVRAIVTSITCLIITLSATAIADTAPKSYQELRNESVKEIMKNLQKYTEKPPVQQATTPQGEQPTAAAQARSWDRSNPWSKATANPWSQQKSRDDTRQPQSTTQPAPNIFLPGNARMPGKPAEEPARNIYQ